MKHLIIFPIIFLIVNQQSISQINESQNDIIRVDYLNNEGRLHEEQIDLLENIGYSSILINELNDYLSFGLVIKSYLDLQSLRSITMNEAKALYSLLFEEYSATEDYYKVVNSVFFSSVLSLDSLSIQHSRLRARHFQRSKEKEFIILTEKDAGEAFVQNTSPYFSDLLSISLRKKLKNKSLYLGSYELCLGQGLLLGQTLSFGQGNQYFNTEKFEPEVNLKTSFGEDNYFFGLTISSPNKNQQLFYVSRRLLDGSLKEDGLFNIRHGGDHSSPSAMSYKNKIQQYNAGIKRVFTFKGFDLQQSLHGQILRSNQDKESSVNLWSSSYSTFNIENYRLFSEIALRFTDHFAYSALLGLSRTIGKKSGVSLVVQKNSTNYTGIYVNHLFGYTTKPFLQYFFVLNQEINRYVHWSIRHEMNLDRLRSNRFDFRLELRRRKYWNLYFKLVHSSKPDEQKLNSSINLKKRINQNIESRTRLHVNNLFFAGEVFINTLLAQDLIYSPLQKPYSLKIRIAFYDQNNTSNNVFAYENSPIGQYSLKQYNQTGLRYTLNFRWKWALTTLECKIHNWIFKDPISVIPFELQLRKVFSSDDMSLDRVNIDF